MEFNLFTCWQHFNLIALHVLEFYKTQKIKQRMVGILRAFIRKSADVLRTLCLIFLTICWAVPSLFFGAVCPPSGLFLSRSLSFHQSVLSVLLEVSCWPERGCYCCCWLFTLSLSSPHSASQIPNFTGITVKEHQTQAFTRSLQTLRNTLSSYWRACELCLDETQQQMLDAAGLPDQFSTVAKVFESGF